MNRDYIAICNILSLLENSNPGMRWAELFGSRVFKNKEEMNRALYSCISACLVEKQPDIFVITFKGWKFLDTFAPKWKIQKVMIGIRRLPIYQVGR